MTVADPSKNLFATSTSEMGRFSPNLSRAISHSFEIRHCRNSSVTTTTSINKYNPALNQGFNSRGRFEIVVSYTVERVDNVRAWLKSSWVISASSESLSLSRRWRIGCLGIISLVRSIIETALAIQAIAAMTSGLLSDRCCQRQDRADVGAQRVCARCSMRFSISPQRGASGVCCRRISRRFRRYGDISTSEPG